MRTAIHHFLLCLCISSVGSFAADLEWTGGTSTFWNEPSNWNPAQLPVAGDNLLFTNAGATNAPGGATGVMNLGPSFSINNLLYTNGSGQFHELDLGGNELQVANMLDVGRDTFGQTNEVTITAGNFTLSNAGNRAGNVAIGYSGNTGTGDIDARLQIGADASNITVNFLDIGRHFAGGASDVTGSLDLSRSGEAHIDANRVYLGTALDNSAKVAIGTLRLPLNGPSTITTPQMWLGNSARAGNQGVTSVLTLGNAATLNVDDLHVGRFKSWGRVEFASGTSGNLLTLDGASGGAANVSLGFNTTGTGTIANGTLDTRLGNITANIDRMILGYHGSGSGGGRGTFLMGGGSVTVNNIDLALTDQGGNSTNDGNTTGDIRMTDGTIIVSDTVSDGNGLGQVWVEGGGMLVANGFAADRIIVGFNGRDGSLTANGPVRLGNGGQNIYVGFRNSGNVFTSGFADFRNAPAVDINAAELRLGGNTSGSNTNVEGDTFLSENGPNTILVNNVTIGDSSAAGNTGVESLLQFGSSTNILRANTIQVGQRKSRGRLELGAGGHLEITSRSSAEAQLRVGYNNTNTGTNPEGNFITTNGTLNATLNQWVVGHHDRGAGSGKGTFHMGPGTVTANALFMANTSVTGTSSNPQNTQGTVIIEGGGSVAVNGAITDGGGVSQIDLNGGTLSGIGNFSVDTLNLSGTTNDTGLLALNNVSGGNTWLMGSLTQATNSVLQLNYSAEQPIIGTDTATFENGALIETGLAFDSGPSTNLAEATTWSAGTNVWDDSTTSRWSNGLPAGTTITNGTSFTALVATNNLIDNGLASGTPGWDVVATTGANGTVDLTRSGPTIQGSQIIALIDDPSATVTRSGGLVIGNMNGSGADASQLLINGGSLEVDGGVSSDGGATKIFVDNGSLVITNGGVVAHDLRVGYQAATGVVEVVGGPVEIGQPATPADIYIARRDGSISSPATGTVNLSNAGRVQIDAATLRIGSANSSNGQVFDGQLLFSNNDSNILNATTIVVGDSPLEGNSAFPLGLTNRITFGSTDNIVTTDRVILGSRKAIGHAVIRPGGTLNLISKSGSGIDLDIGFNEVNGTGTISDGLLDMSGGTIDADLRYFRVGRHNNGAGAGRGKFVMDEGVVSVRVDMELARNSVGGTSSNPTNTIAVVELHGGSLNIAGNMYDDGGESWVSVSGADLSANNIRNVNHLELSSGSIRAGNLTGTESFSMTGGRLAVDFMNTDLIALGGVVAPGDSPGTTTITANHSLGNARWEIEIDGAANDLVAVSSNLTLLAGSALIITNVNDTVNEAIVIASYGTLTGSFTTTNDLHTGWTVDYNYQGGNEIALVQIPGVITNVTTTPGPGGAVVVEWETDDDTGIQGFYVERSDASDQWQRLNGSLIPALTNPAGSSYSYTDTAAILGVEYAYRIIVVETGGDEAIKGPYRRQILQQIALDIPLQNEVRWASNEDEVYTVQRSPSLNPPSWGSVTNGILATPPENMFVDPNSNGERQYYRIVVE